MNSCFLLYVAIGNTFDYLTPYCKVTKLKVPKNSYKLKCLLQINLSFESNFLSLSRVMHDCAGRANGA